MKAKPLPPIEELRLYLSYDSDTGIFTWVKRKHVGPLPGERAGSLESDGYRRIQFNKQHCLEHRLAWLFMTGEDPGDLQIDHIDCNKSNNRWSNFRLATASDNQKNQLRPKSNTSGSKNVCWHKHKKSWIAHVGCNKKLHHIGYFDDFEEARQAVVEYRKTLHKEFTNHG